MGIGHVALALSVGVACAAAPAEAQRRWMQEGEIRAEVTGVHLEGVYPSKVEWHEIVRPDGTTDYYEGSERRPGRWDVKGELFCFVYALPQHGGCFRVVRHSSNCYEIYTASLGGIPPVQPPPATAMAWNGRMWRKTEPYTCDEKPIS
jgi:hypothetical protein